MIKGRSLEDDMSNGKDRTGGRTDGHTPDLREELVMALGSIVEAKIMLQDYEAPGNSPKLRELIWRQRVVLNKAQGRIAGAIERVGTERGRDCNSDVRGHQPRRMK